MKIGTVQRSMYEAAYPERFSPGHEWKIIHGLAKMGALKKALARTQDADSPNFTQLASYVKNVADRAGLPVDVELTMDVVQVLGRAFHRTIELPEVRRISEQVVWTLGASPIHALTKPLPAVRRRVVAGVLGQSMAAPPHSERAPDTMREEYRVATPEPPNETPAAKAGRFLRPHEWPAAVRAGLGAAADVHAALLPTAEAETPPTIDDLCSSWSRASLEPEPTVHGEQVLARLSSPSRESESVEGLRKHLVERLARELMIGPGAGRLEALARELARVVLDDRQRAELWAAGCKDTPFDLVRALLALGLAPGLERVEKSAALERPWDDAIHALVSRPRSVDDSDPSLPDEDDDGIRLLDELRGLLDRAADAEESDLTHLRAWAKRYERWDGGSRAQLPDVVSLPPPSVSAVVDLATLRVIDAWVLRHVGFDDGAMLRAELASLATDLQGAGETLGDVPGLIRAAGTVRAARERIARWSVPDPAACESLVNARSLAAAAWSSAAERIDASSLGAFVAAHPVAPAVVSEIATLFAHRATIDHLPTWWWSAVADAQSTPSGTVELMIVLRSDRSRHLTLAVCQAVAGMADGFDTRMFEQVPVPPTGESPEVHLVEQLRSLAQARSSRARAVENARGSHATTLTLLLERGALDEEAFLAFATRLDEIATRVPTATFACAVAPIGKLGTSEELGAVIRRIEAVVSSAEESWGTAAELTPRQFEAGWAKKRDVTVPMAERPRETLRLDDTNFKTNDVREQKAPLFYVTTGEGRGYLRVPIRVVASEARTRALSIRLRSDKSPLRDALPDRAIAPSVPVTVPDGDWHWHPHSKHYEATLVLTVPVRQPRAGDELVLDLALECDGFEATRSYTWPASAIEVPDAGRQFPEIQVLSRAGEVPALVEPLPVGPQAKWQKIVDDLEIAKPVLVTAPRRFGKSSLRAHVHATLEQRGFAVITVECNALLETPESPESHKALWAFVSQELEKLPHGPSLGSQRDGGAPALPTEEAWRAVRTEARHAGKKGIVLLFDEAQRLFAFRGSRHLGQRLRAQLSGSLSQGTDRLAPVTMAFFGLPSLTADRLSSDLAGLLGEYVHEKLGEERIAQVVKHYAQGALRTTRLARERLAAASWNLFILQRLVARLAELATADRRTWVTLEDVLTTQARICGELRAREGAISALERYVRDGLNLSNDPDLFQPIKEFPLALALALAIEEGRRGPAAVERCRDQLDAWGREIFTGQPVVPTFRRERVDRGLEELVNNGIIEDDKFGGFTFVSEMVQAYLVGARRKFVQGAERADFGLLLQKLGLAEIRLPDDAELIAQGAQAEVKRFHRDGRDYAARVHLEPTAPEALVEGYQLLERLQSLQNTRDEGELGICRLYEVGYLTGSERVVEVYEFIRGTRVDEIRPLEAAAVLELGIALSKSIRLIHNEQILHRDIRPANIMIRADGGSPVLIDFGFARMRATPGRTPLKDEFTAPEVHQEPADWSEAADWYSLAATLKWLLGTETNAAAKEVFAMLDAFMKASKSERRQADRLQERLKSLASRLEIHDAGRRVEKALTDTIQKVGWAEHEVYRKVLQKRSPELTALSLGFYRKETARYERIGDLVNLICEEAQNQSYRSVGDYMRVKYNGRRAPEGVWLLSKLRNTAVHSDPKLPPYDRRKWADDVKKAGAELATAYALPNLPRLLDTLLTQTGLT